MAQSKPLDLILANKLFEHIPAADTKFNFNSKDVVVYKEGDIIFQSGDSAEQIYLILEGEIKIKYNQPIDGQRIFEKGKTEFFGEKEFLEHSSRTSSAVANKPVTLYILRRKELNDLISKNRLYLNNLQGLDSESSSSSNRSSREFVSEEITGLLRNTDSSMDPFRYTTLKNSVESFQTKEYKAAVPPPEEENESLPSVPVSDKKRRTITDEIGFGETFTFAEEPEPEDSETAQKTNDDSVSGFSWDFPSFQSDTNDDNQVTPSQQNDFSGFQFSDEAEAITNKFSNTPDISSQDKTTGSFSGFGINFDIINGTSEHGSPEFNEEENQPEAPVGKSFWEDVVESATDNDETDNSEDDSTIDKWGREQPDGSSFWFGEEQQEKVEEIAYDDNLPSAGFWADTSQINKGSQWIEDQEFVSDNIQQEEQPEAEESGFNWDFSDSESPDITETEQLPDSQESFASIAQNDWKDEAEKVPEPPENWFTSQLPDDDIPIKEFSFDENGNLIAGVPAIPVNDAIDNLPLQTEEIEESSTGDFISSTQQFQEDDKSDTFFSSGFEDDQPVMSFEEIESTLRADKPPQKFDFEAEPQPPISTAQKNDEEGFSKEQLQLIIHAAQLVNSTIKIDEILNSIVQAASSLTEADRGTLYIIDHQAGELWSKVVRGENIEEIRLKIGQGIAGWVAQSGEPISIDDVSSDERFEHAFDQKTGYTTKSMLCYPIKNRAGMIVAVIQLLNSAHGKFRKIDEEFLEALSAHIAIALENAELVEQLLKTDRLTSLGKVAKFLISDIKKPILTIRHLAEHIRKKNVSAEINQVLTLMIEQANIVADLTQTTLSYSEGKSILNKKILSIAKVMDELIDLLAEYVEFRKTKLFKKLSLDVLVNVDKRELYQAFFQITKNACDAMPGGGELYVSTKLSETGDKVIISFKDKGLGIPESIKDKIFEPFMSQGKSHGVGLGLPIAEKIVKEHGGKIEVESAMGEGTTINIILPVVTEF